jgi:predicted Zn finger-like uncharacterized protein
MILKCPSCHARYLVQIGLFAQGGRQVRCARCKHEWHASLPTTIDVFSAVPAAPPPLAPELQPHPSAFAPSPTAPIADTRNATSSPLTDAVRANLPAVIKRLNWSKYKEKARRSAHYIAGGVLAVGLLILMSYESENIVKVLPSMGSIFASLGINVDYSSNGLTFEQVKSELRYDSGTMKLYVEGVIHNTTQTQFIPDIKARALGADKDVIQSWWVDAPAATVSAGSDVPFHTEVVAAMKRTIEDVYLEFHAQGEKGDATP